LSLCVQLSAAHKAADSERYIEEAAHGLWCAAGGTAIEAFSKMTYKPSKLGQSLWYMIRVRW